MLKKSTIVLSSYSSLYGVYSPATSSKTSALSANTAAKRKPLTRPQQHQPCRGYAMVAGGSSRHHHEHLPWPEVTAANVIPTPYHIFNQKKGSPYSKRRFYELVKLYHPDRHSLDGVSGGLPYATKLERYRLVVAANEILSDPVKRGAYDCYGAGWNGQPEALAPRDASEATRGWNNYSGKGWGGGPQGPSQCATWEDWERWYNRDEKGKQEPVYFSNGAFVAFIVIFAALGGIGQATRTGNYSMTISEQRDARHDEMSKELMRRRRASNTCSHRGERIDSFLRQRGPYGHGVIDPQVEGYQKLLPAPEIYSRGDISARSIDIYDGKKDHKAQ